MPPLPADDLRHVLDHTPDVWPELRRGRLLLTGGTGFFGIWLLESLARANRELGLGAQAIVVTRDARAFLTRAPHLAADPAVAFLEGDLLTCELPAGELRGVIHAATAEYPPAEGRDRLALFDADLQGTRRVLELARERGARLLFTSSGAVYGRQPPELSHIDEDFPGAPSPTDADSGYGQAKRVSELLCALHAREHGVQAAISRGFAFVGPRLPLDRNLAIGNFIGDALAGGPIRVLGDGRPRRSYLYAADLAIWLWTIWARGASARPYNVGAEEEISILDLAHLVARLVAPGALVQVAGTAGSGPPGRYVPSTRRAREELGLIGLISLEEAIRRTAAWHRSG